MNYVVHLRYMLIIQPVFNLAQETTKLVAMLSFILRLGR